MRLPRELFAIVLAFCTVVPTHFVSGNTEIVNFDASPSTNILFPQTLDWPVLNPTTPHKLLRVLPASVDTPITSVCEPITAGQCENEKWLSLDLDEQPWLPYSKFTLRISWPASHPAEFYIELHSPESLASVVPDANDVQEDPPNLSSTRRKYARIRVIHQGVLTPSRSNQNRTVKPVPFEVIVEPLYLGVIPASLVPTLVFLLVLVGVTAFVVLPRIQAYVFAVASQVRSEAAFAEERRKQ
ncbi:hypothetical protein BV20DRAFT_995650 [Pilatotrama ljubarskyi]|nr:hypothetical protein BV20DRAFT_995650 [Pilatotrama ljubarskyi]